MHLLDQPVSNYAETMIFEGKENKYSIKDVDVILGPFIILAKLL